MRNLILILVFLQIGLDAPASLGASVADLAERAQWEQLREGIAAEEDVDLAQADGMTALHWAGFHDAGEVIGELVAAGAEVDAVNEYSVSPLSLACEYGNHAAAMALLEAGADANSARLGKETPLMLAARAGDRSIVRQLIASGAKIEAQEFRQQTALMWAAAAGNIEVVDELISAGAKIEYRLPNSDFSALMFAARQGHGDVVMRLLDTGLEIDDTMRPKKSGGRDPRKGTTALLLAVESGHLDLALQLVKRGADPNDRSSGFAALHAITWVRRTELGDNPEGDPAPKITGTTNTLDFVRKIVALGGDVNLPVKGVKRQGQRLHREGATPFFLAARGADLALMRLLMELGADPRMTNVDGTNALMAAAGVGVVAVGEEPGSPEEVNRAVRLLSELGLDIDTVDKKGNTAMHGAALRTFPTTVATLANLGANPKIWNTKNDRGWTPHDIGGGKRPGSVKPSPETLAALDAALLKRR